LLRHHARLAGWSATEVVRATAGAQEPIPFIDFVAEAAHCPLCGAAVQAQKSERRRVVTLAAGAFVAREVRKRCGSDSTHPVLVSEKLSCHFLVAIGKKLFDNPYAVLRNLLRQSKVRKQLRDLLRELRQHTTAEVYAGKFGVFGPNRRKYALAIGRRVEP
jgi:hypothetical protein